MTLPQLAESDSLMRLYAPEECTGKGGYPPEWHATVKHAVRELAEHRCVRCLHPYVKGAGEWSACDDLCVHASDQSVRVRPTPVGWGTVQELRARGHEVDSRWRILTVHHLDGNKGNLRWWNLASLCQRCHLQIQGKVKMERVYPWEHSAWFRPYVAGYYAWTYLGQEITRAEAVERMGELLALECAA